MSNQTRSTETKSASAETKDPVGYGRPPRHSRFKPGKSGNPRGRRSEKKTMGDLLRKLFLQPVTLTISGKKKRVPMYVALVHQHLGLALKGDARAFQAVLKMAREIDAIDASELKQTTLLNLEQADLAQLSDGALKELIAIEKKKEEKLKLH